MKVVLASAMMILLVAGTAASRADSVGSFIAKYHTTHVANPAAVSRKYRALLFPPAPHFPNGLYQLAGNETRVFALECGRTFGKSAPSIRRIGNECAVFYFPASAKGSRVKIKIPAAESGSLY